MHRQAATSIWSFIPRRTRPPHVHRTLRSPIGRRRVQIAATPSSTSPPPEAWNGDGAVTSHPDARFEVLGSPSSLLSVSLSASQPLYTRRGTLIAFSGKPENAVSTLSLLSPIKRSLGGVPFLYQKLSSTSPLTALISSRTPSTTFAVVYLDGRLDWIVAQRTGLLAWTGAALSVKPQLRFGQGLGLSHWGQSLVTGRGLLALVGRGQIYQVQLKSGEEYVVHPANVLAYSAQHASSPQPYRFRSHSVNLQIPSLLPSTFAPLRGSRFARELRKTAAYRVLAAAAFALRTWARRSLWGDRLFLRFQGPATVLLQSRAAGLREALSDRDVNEIADAPAGALWSAVESAERKEKDHAGEASRTTSEGAAQPRRANRPTKVSFATVRSGKVEMRD